MRIRRKRGGNAIEFALTMPIFTFIMMGVLEYGYYFYMTALVEDATRVGCRLGATIDPETGDSPSTVAATEINAKLTDYGVPCTGTCDLTTSIVVYGEGTVDTPEELQVAENYLSCETTFPYTQLVGLMNIFPNTVQSQMVIRMEFQDT